MDDLAAETETTLNKLRETHERKSSNAPLTKHELWCTNTLKNIDMIELVLRGMGEDVVDDNMYEALGDASDAIVKGLIRSMIDYYHRRKDAGDIFFTAVMDMTLCGIVSLGDTRGAILRSVCCSAMRTIGITEKNLDAVASVKRVGPNSVVAAYDCIRTEGLDEQIARAIDRYGDAFRVGAKTKAAR